MEDFKGLDLTQAKTLEEIEKLIVEKLNISLPEMKEAICKYVDSHAEELTHQFANIAPYENYEKLLEDNDSMADFLKVEATKQETWHLDMIQPDNKNPNLLEFSFHCKAVDDGNTMKGFAYVGVSGKIRHAFACGN